MKNKLCPSCKNNYDVDAFCFHDDPEGEFCNGCIRQLKTEMKKVYPITDDKFLEAKKAITENGGTIYADGRFEVCGVEGRFQRDGNILTIVITDKPWLASLGMIEEKLDEFFL